MYSKHPDPAAFKYGAAPQSCSPRFFFTLTKFPIEGKAEVCGSRIYRQEPVAGFMHEPPSHEIDPAASSIYLLHTVYEAVVFDGQFNVEVWV
jgi:hypothetical protein